MSATPEKMIEMIMNCSLTPMTDDYVGYDKEGFAINRHSQPEWVVFCRTMELRMHKSEDALEELAPFLRGQMENDILTSKYQDAIKMALAVVDTPNPDVSGSRTASQK